MPRRIHDRPLKAKRPDSKRSDRSEAEFLVRFFIDLGNFFANEEDFRFYGTHYEIIRRTRPMGFDFAWDLEGVQKEVEANPHLYNTEAYYRKLAPYFKKMAAHLRKSAYELKPSMDFAGVKQPVFNDATIRKAIQSTRRLKNRGESYRVSGSGRYGESYFGK